MSRRQSVSRAEVQKYLRAFEAPREFLGRATLPRVGGLNKSTGTALAELIGQPQGEHRFLWDTLSVSVKKP